MNSELTLEPASSVEASPLLDYTHPSIERLIESKGWHTIKDGATLIQDVFLFVRDEIAYGYTKSFSIPASQVLCDRIGNGITKSTLFMALLRAVGIPCRFHAITISKVIFRGLLSGPIYKIADKQPFRAWVEVLYKDKWYQLEGHIIDTPYIQKLQQKYPNQKGSFYGYGIAVIDFKNLDNRWGYNHGCIQNRAINTDLGTFETPDMFFSTQPEAEHYAKALRYQTIICNNLNRSIKALRNRS